MGTTTSRRTAAAVGLLLLFYMVGLVLVGSPPAGATHVDPQLVIGNENCAAATGTSELLRLESGAQLAVGSATYQVSGGSISVTIHQGATFDWSSSVSIAAVFVKGGPNGNLYDYRPLSGASNDQGLHAPVNPSNGGLYGLSHITFCRFDTPPTTAPSTTVGETTITTVPETTVPETTVPETTVTTVPETTGPPVSVDDSTVTTAPATTTAPPPTATVLGTVIESSTTIPAVSASTLPFTGFELENTLLLAVAALMVGTGLLLLMYGTEKPAKVSRIPGKW